MKPRRAVPPTKHLRRTCLVTLSATCIYVCVRRRLTRDARVRSASDEEEVVPRATRNRPGDGTAGGEDSGEESGLDETEVRERKQRDETPCIGQRQLVYAWRPLDAPLDWANTVYSIVRASAHSAAGEVLLAIVDVLMLLTRKDRLFANKKLVQFKLWLEHQGVSCEPHCPCVAWVPIALPSDTRAVDQVALLPFPALRGGPRATSAGWRGSRSGRGQRSGPEGHGYAVLRVLGSALRAALDVWAEGRLRERGGALAGTPPRILLLCLPLAVKLSLVADRDRWLQAAGGRQWLQAEVEQPGGGNAVSAALRARFRRTTELENASRLTAEQEAMAAAMPRWFALLLRAVRASAATGGQDAGPADASSRPAWRGVPGELSEEQVLEEVVIALRRSVPLSRFPPLRTGC